MQMISFREEIKDSRISVVIGEEDENLLRGSINFENDNRLVEDSHNEKI